MIIPNELTMRETAHGHGANGMAFYGYEDTEGLGVQMDMRRESSRNRFVETWFHVALPEQQYSSYAELRAAVATPTNEQIAIEASKYPHFRSVKPDTCGNACRLCPRPPYTGARVKHNTTRVQIAKCWRAATDWSLSLCTNHLAQFAGKPAELVAALNAELAERKARAAAKGLPW